MLNKENRKKKASEGNIYERDKNEERKNSKLNPI
jgi:hypothetical protein